MITDHDAPAWGIMLASGHLAASPLGVFATNNIASAEKLAADSPGSKVVPVKEISTRRRGCGSEVKDIVPA